MGTILIFRAISLILPYLMYFHLPYYALAQSSSSISRNPVVTSPSPSPSTTVYTGTPSLVFGNVPTMTACQNGLVLFNLYNEDPSKINITLYAINEGIDQSIPSPATTASVAQTSRAVSSAAMSSQVALASSPKPTVISTSVSPAAPVRPSSTGSAAPGRRDLQQRTILDLNITLVTQYANHGWNFNPVRLPEGRYYILGVVDDDGKTTNKSAVFSVVEDDDTSCLSAFKSLSASATAATATKNKGVTAKITSTASSGVAVGSGQGEDQDTTEKKGISGGAIGGIVVGVIVGLAALILLFFCYRRKQRRSRNGNNVEESGFRGNAFGRKSHHHSKMPSETNTPSDSGHGDIIQDRGQIAMTPVRSNGSSKSNKSDEKRVSLNSFEPRDVVEDLPGPDMLNTPPISAAFTTSSGFSGNRSGESDIDPFSTPTLGEIPTMSPIYANDEMRKFGTPSIRNRNQNHQNSETPSSTPMINPPQPVILANVKRYSQEESPKRTTGTTSGLGKGLGLGWGVGSALKSSSSTDSSSSLPYQQNLDSPSPSNNGISRSPSKSEPDKKKSSSTGLGSPPPPSSFNNEQSQISPDPNSFLIPSSNSNAVSGGGGGLGRSASSRRKPVPSLGPELRTELARQGSLKDLKKGKSDNGHGPANENNGGRRRSYKLMPDPPIIHE